MVTTWAVVLLFSVILTSSRYQLLNPNYAQSMVVREEGSSFHCWLVLSWPPVKSMRIGSWITRLSEVMWQVSDHNSWSWLLTVPKPLKLSYWTKDTLTLEPARRPLLPLLMSDVSTRVMRNLSCLGLKSTWPFFPWGNLQWTRTPSLNDL